MPWERVDFCYHMDFCYHIVKHFSAVLQKDPSVFCFFAVFVFFVFAVFVIIVVFIGLIIFAAVCCCLFRFLAGLASGRWPVCTSGCFFCLPGALALLASDETGRWPASVTQSGEGLR